jgi:hypothetical protein
VSWSVSVQPAQRSDRENHLPIESDLDTRQMALESYGNEKRLNEQIGKASGTS